MFLTISLIKTNSCCATLKSATNSKIPNSVFCDKKIRTLLLKIKSVKSTSTKCFRVSTVIVEKEEFQLNLCENF